MKLDCLLQFDQSLAENGFSIFVTNIENILKCTIYEIKFLYLTKDIQRILQQSEEENIPKVRLVKIL